MSTSKIKQIVTNFDDLQQNIDFFSKILLSDGVISFKKMFLSVDEQAKLAVLFGDFCDWVPNSKRPEIGGTMHHENHELAIKLKEKNIFQNTNLLIEWHLEQPFANDPQVGALWNNINFKCSREFGKTGFVDMRKVSELIPSSEWREILNATEWFFPWSNRKKPVISKHRITGEPILVYDMQHFALTKCIINGKEATDNENKILRQIFAWAEKQIKNPELQTWYEWDEGDLVVTDLQTMCHCVTGGFLSTEREFIACWCYHKNTIDAERELENINKTKFLKELAD